MWRFSMSVLTLLGLSVSLLIFVFLLAIAQTRTQPAASYTTGTPAQIEATMNSAPPTLEWLTITRDELRAALPPENAVPNLLMSYLFDVGVTHWVEAHELEEKFRIYPAIAEQLNIAADNGFIGRWQTVWSHKACVAIQVTIEVFDSPEHAAAFLDNEALFQAYVAAHLATNKHWNEDHTQQWISGGQTDRDCGPMQSMGIHVPYPGNPLIISASGIYYPSDDTTVWEQSLEFLANQVKGNITVQSEAT